MIWKMKLRATVARPELLRDVCSSFASLNKTCQLRFNEEGLEITSMMDSGNIHLCSTGLTRHRLFERYEMSSRYNNTLVMDVNADNLQRVLAKTGSSQVEDDLTLKLRKRDQTAYLAIEFGLYINGAQLTDVSQLVPIRLQREGTTPPYLPDARMDVFVRAPEPISSLVRVSDRYRNLGPTLSIRASKNGRFQIATADAINSVVVETTWQNVTVLQLVNDPESTPAAAEDDDTLHSVTVSTKEWFSVLQMHSVAKTVSIGISNDEFLVVYCKLTEDNANQPKSQDPGASQIYTEDDEAYLVYVLSHHEV